MFRLSKYGRKILALILILLFIVSMPLGACATYAKAEDENLSRRVVGYLPTWSYSAYKNIDFSALTHINIAFCNPNNKGEIECGIPENDMRAIVDKAHADNVKVMAALGGGGYGEPYRELISSADKINVLNLKIVNFCEKYDLDGIDLDIEITSSDIIWQNYGNWVSELRLICDARDWLLSSATAQWVAESTTAETFALFDFLNVMAYDNDSRGSNSHSSYEFAVDCLNYFSNVKNVPKENLILGVPFYGRGYDSNGALDWNSYMSFADLVKTDEENYSSDFYGNIAYTGADTMRRKCQLSKEYGGIMIWEITLDAQGDYSLLKVIKEQLLSAAEVPEDKPDNQNNGNTLWIVIGVVGGVVAIVAVAAIVAFVKKGKTGKNGLV